MKRPRLRDLAGVFGEARHALGPSREESVHATSRLERREYSGELRRRLGLAPNRPLDDGAQVGDPFERYVLFGVEQAPGLGRFSEKGTGPPEIRGKQALATRLDTAGRYGLRGEPLDQAGPLEAPQRFRVTAESHLRRV